MVKRIAIVNKSTVISAADASKIAIACNIQISRDYCPAWSRTAVPVTLYQSESAVPSDATIVYLLDNSDVDGALGYHDELSNGKVYAKVFAKTTMKYGCPAVYDAKKAKMITVSSVVSHEILEILGNQYCDLWADGPSIAEGNQYAYELCDPVEADVYTVAVGSYPGTPVSVSNFVYPEYFDTATPKGTQLDQMKTLTKPYTMSKNGYLIVRNASYQISEIFGSTYPDFLKESKSEEFTKKLAASGNRIPVVKSIPGLVPTVITPTT